MKSVAIIPARGGSKRLPRKNIVNFLGHPILAYTIEAALGSKCFERVIVSTDDNEIAAIGKKAGAYVHQRGASLSTDSARVVDVCLDFLAGEEQAGRTYDALACLYATAPLRNAADVSAVFGLLDPGRCDFAMAVTDYGLAPHQAMRQAADGGLSPVWPDIVNARADEIGVLRVDNGSTYAVTVPAFRREKTFYGPNLRGYFMPRLRSVDIDTADDLTLALLCAKHFGLGPIPA